MVYDCDARQCCMLDIVSVLRIELLGMMNVRNTGSEGDGLRKKVREW